MKFFILTLCFLALLGGVTCSKKDEGRTVPPYAESTPSFPFMTLSKKLSEELGTNLNNERILIFKNKDNHKWVIVHILGYTPESMDVTKFYFLKNSILKEFETLFLDDFSDRRKDCLPQDMLPPINTDSIFGCIEHKLCELNDSEKAWKFEELSHGFLGTKNKMFYCIVFYNIKTKAHQIYYYDCFKNKLFKVTDKFEKI